MEATTPARQEWLEARRKGIGGSDVAGILGISPWQSQMDVWLQKRGEAPPGQPTEAQWWGTAMEDMIAQRYTEKTGVGVFAPADPLFYHPQNDVLLATPDRIATDYSRGLEIKTASTYSADAWGEPGTDEIPPYYLTQVLHYMEVLAIPLWDVAVLIGGNDFRVYTVRGDRAVQRAMMERCLAWWEKHVVQGERPPVGSEGVVDRWVQHRFPREAPGVRLNATREVDQWALELETARAYIAQYETAEQTLVNNLKLAIGEAEGIDGDGWRITFKQAKGRETVDWQGLAEAVMRTLCPAARQEWVDRFKNVAPGRRRFLFTRKKEGAKR